MILSLIDYSIYPPNGDYLHRFSRQKIYNYTQCIEEVSRYQKVPSSLVGLCFDLAFGHRSANKDLSRTSLNYF